MAESVNNKKYFWALWQLSNSLCSRTCQKTSCLPFQHSVTLSLDMATNWHNPMCMQPDRRQVEAFSTEGDMLITYVTLVLGMGYTIPEWLWKSFRGWAGWGWKLYIYIYIYSEFTINICSFELVCINKLYFIGLCQL